MNKLKKLENLLKREAWATYFIGRYYYAVNTFKTRRDFGLAPGEVISSTVQKDMQSWNLIALFHEYLHYIHEISTVIGNINLSLDVALKSIFSLYFDKDLKSCEHLGINRYDKLNFEKFIQFHITKETINGSMLVDVKILRILKLTNKSQIVQIPNGTGAKKYSIKVPLVKAEVFMEGKYKMMNLYFGKFFLYEGLAYELDRELERQLRGEAEIRDTGKLSEYTVLRLVANFVYPGVTTRQFLCLASLSLSYLDSGAVFIALLKKAKEANKERQGDEQFLEKCRKEARTMLSSKIVYFEEAQDELTAVFEKRADLFKAFSAVCGAAKSGYKVRAEHPTFEVDLLFDGKYQELLDRIPICDYMYVFTDADAFDRDFFGTSSFSVEVSRSLKALIAYDHYQKSHELWSTEELEAHKPVKCPFFSCCNLELRKSHETICAERPWRIFEVSAGTDQQYCWYGVGVGEYKSHTEK